MKQPLQARATNSPSVAEGAGRGDSSAVRGSRKCSRYFLRETVRTSPSPQQRPLCSLFQSLRATPPFGNQRPLLYGFLRPRSIPLANANTRVTQTTPFLRARAFRRRKRKMVSPCNPTDSISSSSGRVETLFQGVHVSLIFS